MKNKLFNLQVIIALACIGLTACGKSELQICVEIESAKSLSQKEMHQALKSYEEEPFEKSIDGTPEKLMPYTQAIEIAASKIVFSKGARDPLFELIQDNIPSSRRDKLVGLVPDPMQDLESFLAQRAQSIAFEDVDIDRDTSVDQLLKVRLRGQKLAREFMATILYRISEQEAELLCNERGIYQ